MLEFGYDQRAAIVALAQTSLPAAEIYIVADYAGWDRLAVIRTAAL
jgi:hypothetical protein